MRAPQLAGRLVCLLAARMCGVGAGVGSVMCSYNKVNGTYACENEPILGRDLKGRMGYKGWVMSDWGATHRSALCVSWDDSS